MKETIRPNIKGVFPKLSDGLYSVSLGNGTQIEVGIMRVTGRILFSVIGKGSYTFSVGTHSWGYINEKIPFNGYDGDAMNFADFVSSQFSSEFKKQGDYMASLCSVNFLEYTVYIKPAGFNGLAGGDSVDLVQSTDQMLALAFPEINTEFLQEDRTSDGPDNLVCKQIDRVRDAYTETFIELVNERKSSNSASDNK